MRVITLQEPWASLIGEGVKTIETRSWPCAQLGELYIHAGKAKIKDCESRKINLSSRLRGPLHYGSIFVKCNLVDCVLITEEYADEIRSTNPDCFLCGDFTPGRYAWVLADIEPIEPIEARGKLGIWYFGEQKIG